MTKVNGIDTTNFVSNTKYEKDGSDFENKINKMAKKIPDISDLVKKTDINAKMTEVEGKIPSITGLATSSALIIMIMTSTLLLQNLLLWQKMFLLQD